MTDWERLTISQQRKAAREGEPEDVWRRPDQGFACPNAVKSPVCANGKTGFVSENHRGVNRIKQLPTGLCLYAKINTGTFRVLSGSRLGRPGFGKTTVHNYWLLRSNETAVPACSLPTDRASQRMAKEQVSMLRCVTGFSFPCAMVAQARCPSARQTQGIKNSNDVLPNDREDETTF